MEQIVIVGAGPTGLTLAAELRRLGHTPVLLDKLAEGQNTSRAAVIHARTLEVLEPLGVVEALLREGLMVPLFRIRDRDRVLASVDFNELETPFPYTLMCPQDRTEAILLSRLQDLGGDVRRPVEVSGLEVSETGVVLTLQTKAGVERLSASHVVGCDGMHSAVRKAAGIPFAGDAYEEHFVLADVEMDWPFDRKEVDLFFSSKGLVVVAPLPHNRYRIVATMQDAPECATAAVLEKLLLERGPLQFTPKLNRLWWSSRFRVHHRLATTFRKGRILLAGDAAHVHSPAGGQGMNTGIQDAVALSQALTTCIRSGSERALDDWAVARRVVAQGVVTMTDRATRIATLDLPLERFGRNTLVSLLGHVPAVRHAIAERLAELSTT